MYSEKLLLSLNSASAFASCGASLPQAKKVANTSYIFLFVNAVYKKHNQISTYPHIHTHMSRDSFQSAAACNHLAQILAAPKPRALLLLC